MPPGLAKTLTTEFPYYYAWNRMGRKDQRCAVLVRAKAMNSCLVQFEDGYQAVTSRNAIRKIKWPSHAREGGQTLCWMNP